MEIDKRRSPVNISATHQEVRVREWKSLNEGILSTEGVQPCTLVALYDPDPGVGYLGHFTIELYQNDEGFHDMIETAKSNNPNAKLQAWVGGAALLRIFGTGVHKKNRSIYNELIQANRDYVVETLQELDCPLIQDWLDYESQIIDLAFDTDKGKITYSSA